MEMLWPETSVSGATFMDDDETRVITRRVCRSIDGPGIFTTSRAFDRGA